MYLKQFLLLCALLSLLAMTAGCGQKGALYIPDKPEKTQKQKN